MSTMLKALLAAKLITEEDAEAVEKQKRVEEEKKMQTKMQRVKSDPRPNAPAAVGDN